MPDAPLPPTPAPADNIPGTSPSPLNEAQIASLTKTEEICRVALLPEYLAILTTLDEGEILTEDHLTEEKIQGTLTLCTQARGAASSAVTATGGKKRITKKEQDAEKTLLEILRFFQARARQKYFFKTPGILKEYGIGEDIDASRPILEGFAQLIYDKTATDPLPRITPAKRTALLAALDAYKKAQTDQTGAISEAGTHLDTREDLVKQATAGRMTIQFAADADFPHTDPKNLRTRTAFQLPANRAFIG